MTSLSIVRPPASSSCSPLQCASLVRSFLPATRPVILLVTPQRVRVPAAWCASPGAGQGTEKYPTSPVGQVTALTEAPTEQLKHPCSPASLASNPSMAETSPSDPLSPPCSYMALQRSVYL
ncbi:hypothetical protein RRG08_041130 [Elysia crispata]|uniref:Uncharacterized protein n=1 Tax=Elysia crispata TaxID=231223 RepID=A0AAE0XY54_9GAST|nr:hypothetical protein RRG08_041130 [Elysia crispata]